MNGMVHIRRSKRVLSIALAIFSVSILAAPSPVPAQTPQAAVAIHVSENTQALETMPATGQTPGWPDGTGYQWWYRNWHYFVMPESLKEALRSDGTPFVTVSDADIAEGNLLNSDGSPKYPIVISLAAEAIADNEIAPLVNYVNAGGFLFVGSSAFTRNPDGTYRGDFALANEMGLHTVSSNFLQWWYQNQHFTKVIDHRLVAQIPAGTLNWRMPLSSEEIPEGVSPNHPRNWNHEVFQVSADSGTTVIANGDSGPLLATRQYGKGNFIYHGAMEPLMGYSEWDPGMYAYLIYRNAIEWAFEIFNLPIIKLSPWPYDYNAAFIIRHDFENDPTRILSIENSAAFEQSVGAKGDYYFCTGTLRSEMTGTDQTTAIAGLRSAVTNYGATIGSHNGGLPNPVNSSLLVSDFDYWHWGPDEALNVTPSGYASGAAYAEASILQSFQDIEGWLAGVDNGRPGSGCGSTTPNTCPRIWASPYFNSTREASYSILQDLNVVSATEQKIGPFPHWTLSTQTAGKRYPFITLPVSDWYDTSVSTDVLPQLADYTSATTMQEAVDFYYNLGALINFYDHQVSSDTTLEGAYVTYCAYKPFMWKTNTVGIYDWWTARSNVVVTPSFSITGNTATAQATVTGATDPGTSIEMAIPSVNNQNISNLLQVLINDAPSSSYRTIGNTIKVNVGVSAPSTTVKIQYTVNNPAPTITGLSPATALLGGEDFTLTVNGTGFINSSVVQWNGDPRTTTFVSSTQLTATITAADIATAGTAIVTVFNPKPEGGTSNPQIFTISKVTATVTLGNLNQTYDGTPKSVTVTTNPAGLTVNVTYNGSSTPPTDAGSYAVIATVSDNIYQGTAIGTLVINKAAAVVTLGNLNQTYDGTPKSVTATTNPTGLNVTFTYNGSSTAPTNGGSYTVVATVNDANYQGTASGTLVINKAAAAVTLGNLSQTYDGTPKSATATTNPTGLNVTFTYNGSATAPTNGGSYAVVATVNDINYQGTANGTLTIAAATATVTLGNLSQTYDGTPKSVTAITNPAGLSVTFTYNGSATPPTVVGSYSVVATVNDPNYQGTASGTLVIGKATATITLGSLSQTYDGTPKAATATTTPSGLNVTFTYNGSATPPTVVGNYTVVATVNDGNYQGSATGTLTIAKALPVITWSNPAAITYGTALSATQLNATANVPGSFAYTPAAGAVLNAGIQTLSVTFTPTDTANYTTAIASVQITVNKAGQTITVGTHAPANAAYNSQFTVAATASSGLAVTYSSGSPSVCSNSGAVFTLISASGTCVVQYDQAGNADFAAAPQVKENTTAQKAGQATLNIAAPASLTYGGTATLSTTGGSGTGAVSYSVGGSTGCSVTGSTLSVTNAGGTCSVTATKAADANYSAATSSAATVTLQKAALTVTADNKSRPYGSPNPTLTVSYSAFQSTDTAASLTTQPTASTTAMIDSPTGNYPITVSGGVSNNYAFTYVSGTLSIGLADQATLNIAAPASLTYGSTATLSTTGGSGTGAVSYSVGGSTGCSVTGSTLSVTNAGGTCSVTATKAADANYSAATSSAATVTLNKATPTMNVSSNFSRSAFGDSVTFTATFTGAGATGTVAFADNGSTIGTGTLFNGKATYTTSALNPGTHPITATYSGDANFAAAASPALSQTIVWADGILDGSGTLDVTDALKALRIVAGLDTPAPSDFDHGDVAPLVSGRRQPDGKITSGDVVAILRKSVGLPSW